MTGDITVNDDNSGSEKCNEEKEDSEIGRSNYYFIKANNTKWQAKQQTRNIRTKQALIIQTLQRIVTREASTHHHSQ
jgi:hypothetical protein